MKLEETVKKIRSVDPSSGRKAWEHWDSLCKPLRGFGKLEEMVVQLAAIQGTENPCCRKRAIVIMGADNGVVREGVSQTGSDGPGPGKYGTGDQQRVRHVPDPERGCGSG